MKRAVYMMVSRDKYELPMAVADTLKELGGILGVSHTSISHQIRRQEAGTMKRRSKYVKVMIEEDEKE